MGVREGIFAGAQLSVKVPVLPSQQYNGVITTSNGLCLPGDIVDGYLGPESIEGIPSMTRERGIPPFGGRCSAWLLWEVPLVSTNGNLGRKWL